MEPNTERHTPHRWIKDRDHRFLEANSALARTMGESPMELVGRSDADFFRAKEVRRYRRDDRRVAACGRPLLVFEPSLGVPVPGWITKKTPLRRAGVPAVAGEARPWSTRGIHEALELPARIDGTATEGSPWLLQVERSVRDRFREGIAIQDLADDVGLHADYFGRRFREVVGLDVHGLVRKLRIAWCIERLGEAESSLSSLAYRSGFSDQSHFTRAFKRETGLPPGAFRETLH